MRIERQRMNEASIMKMRIRTKAIFLGKSYKKNKKDSIKEFLVGHKVIMSKCDFINDMINSDDENKESDKPSISEVCIMNKDKKLRIYGYTKLFVEFMNIQAASN